MNTAIIHFSLFIIHFLVVQLKVGVLNEINPFAYEKA